ncbi:MAG: TVP38/TMEM64 family protein [Gemmatimonadaceae bacterium]
MSARRTAGAAPHDGASLSRRATLVRVGIMIALFVTAVLVAWRFGLFELRDPERLAAAVRRARGVTAIAPLFVAAYAIVATFGLPATPFTLAGGAIFGTVLGSVLNWCGAVLGALGAFLLAKGLGRDAVRKLLGSKLAKLDGLVERGGFATIFRLRLLPVVPFNLLSFAAGLAGVPLRAYLLGTALGIVPGTVVYTYFADSLIAGAEGASRAALVKVGVAAALLIAVSFAPALVRRFQHASLHRAGD